MKWAGGKRQLIDELRSKLPESFRTYCEPFVGGGALFWSLGELKPRRIILNDLNKELMIAYQAVQQVPGELIEHLRIHAENHSENYYYQIRSMDRDDDFENLSIAVRAARFIYLNRTGYNGLWRVNNNGHHNVPFGKYENPKILDEENIWSCHEYLQGVILMQGDFRQVSRRLGRASFVYFDPPYEPISQSANFTSYTKGGFDSYMQVELRDFCDRLNRRKVKFMVSNSKTPLIEKLYNQYNIDYVHATRSINCKGYNRGKVGEVIIRNYE